MLPYLALRLFRNRIIVFQLVEALVRDVVVGRGVLHGAVH